MVKNKINFKKNKKCYAPKRGYIVRNLCTRIYKKNATTGL